VAARQSYKREHRVGDVLHVLADHLGVLLPADRSIIVDDLVVDELVELVQPPTVQCVDVGAVDLFKVTVQWLLLILVRLVRSCCGVASLR
jgi:hypothetical protein